jgi:hypothetical protein
MLVLAAFERHRCGGISELVINTIVAPGYDGSRGIVKFKDGKTHGPDADTGTEIDRPGEMMPARLSRSSGHRARS